MTPRGDRIFISLRKGEQAHSLMTTPWHEGKGGEMCWRLISKKRLDGRIEVVHFIRQKSGIEMLSAHVVCAENKLEDLLAKIKNAIWQFAPGLEIRVGRMEDFDPVEWGPYFVFDAGLDERLKKKGPRF
ncbi:MAG: hypothetical protein HYY18_21735 [Planctomycetes bacterium]|nr:hypothetical protein [Planctomycetota bacterium]